MLHIKRWSFDWQLCWKLRTIIDIKYWLTIQKLSKIIIFKGRNSWERKRKQGDLWHTMNPWFSSTLITVCSYGYWSLNSEKGFKGIFEDVQRKDYKSDLKWLLCTEQWKWKNRWLKEIWKRSSWSWGAVKNVEIHFSLSVPKKEVGDIRWN